MAEQPHKTNDDASDAAAMRAVATDVVRTLVQAGFVAYFAGGCVRDRLMGLTPGDYDVATDATPDDVRTCFRSVHHVGESFGVSLVRQSGVVIEVATFRIDGTYEDGRHPDHVTFSDAQHDAQRRDFTINGLFEDPLTDEVIDYVGGQSDLNAKLIRAIGSPKARFDEDHLRMLRAVRFAARFDLTIEDDTASAIRDHAEHLEGVSRERVGQEVRRMLEHPSRARAMELLQELQLDGVVFGDCLGGHPNPTLRGLQPNSDSTTAFAALLIDRDGLPGAGESMVDASIHRLRRAMVLSNDEVSILRQSMAVLDGLQSQWKTGAVARRKRLASATEFPRAMTLLAMLDDELCNAIASDVDDLARTGLAPRPFLNGNHLISMGYAPGPRFREVIELVYDAQLEQRVASEDEAFDLAASLFRSDSD